MRSNNIAYYADSETALSLASHFQTGLSKSTAGISSLPRQSLFPWPLVLQAHRHCRQVGETCLVRVLQEWREPRQGGHQQLKVGAVEFEVAWAPYFMSRMDDVYTARAVGVSRQRFKHNALPSDFFRQNIFLSFQEDALGIELRSHIGVENLLWASDYPHAESTFPQSRAIVDRILRGVPEPEQVQIAGANTARLYHFSTEKPRPHATVVGGEGSL